MSMLAIQTIQDTLVGWTGSLAIAALLILAFFFIVLLIIGIDFRFSLIFVVPLAVAFSVYGWFPTWVSILFWIFFIGFGLFTFMKSYESY